MLRSTQIEQALKKIKQMHRDEGLQIVGYFGSYADKSADAFSDVDVAYSIDYEKFSTLYEDGFSKLLQIDRVKKEIEALLHAKVDFISLQGGDKAFTDMMQKNMRYL